MIWFVITQQPRVRQRAPDRVEGREVARGGVPR
jgi:hypothetical protein